MSAGENSNSQGNRALEDWLDCATMFCELVKTLDREGVNQAAWYGHKVANGLHWDARIYLRAAGVVAERFSRAAEAFVQCMTSKHLELLTFTVEAGEPIVDGELAILRIQRLGETELKESTPVKFVPIGLEQRSCEPLLFGAEARVALQTNRSKRSDTTEHYQMTPSIRLTYEVAGQQALWVFASVLQSSSVQCLWEAVGGFDVETSILLTRENSQESIEQEWTTSADSDGKRLLKFCLTASQLSSDETRDWPPYLRLSHTLDSTSTEDELERYFLAISAHAGVLVGQSGGWNEILDRISQRSFES